MPAKTATDAINFGDLPKTFEGLCRYHPPRPIRDRIDLDNTTAIIDVMAGHRLNADQSDYLDTISTLVERYEDEHDPVDTSSVSGADLLGELMEANELTTSDVAAIIDVDRSLVSHLRAGRRGMTWGHAKALAEYFALTPAAFMEG